MDSLPSSSYNNDGTVNIPFASGGCDNAAQSSYRLPSHCDERG